MKRLMNRTKNLEVASDIKVADTFYTRLKGLIGERSLPEGQGLWINSPVRFNSVHTWFMNFSIDVVFVDERLIARKVYENLAPWRFTMPAFGVCSVIELPAGTLQKRPIEVGDELHVGD